jgi:hypothetical protein
MYHCKFNLRHAAGVAAAIAAAVPFAAGAAVPVKANSTEQMLAAAGFQAVPANTAERQSEMAALPARRLLSEPDGDGFTYVYADPTGCDCLYLGDAAAYQSYQQLALDRNIAWQDAFPYRYGGLNWDLWGPFGGYGLYGGYGPYGGFDYPIGIGGGHFHGNGGHFGGNGGSRFGGSFGPGRSFGGPGPRVGVGGFGGRSGGFGGHGGSFGGRGGGGRGGH